MSATPRQDAPSERVRSQVVVALGVIGPQIEALLDEMALNLERAPSEAVTVDLETLGNLVLAMDDIKIQLEDGKKAINRVAQRIHDHFCRQIVDAEEVPYRHPKATFTPHVDSEFSIKNAAALFDHLQIAQGLSVEAARERFVELAQKKSERKKLCQSHLEDGQPLPDGMKGFSWAKVIIRRKRRRGNGQDEEGRGGEDEF